MRRIGRAMTWPLRRFFDPRFGGIAATQDATLAEVAAARAEGHARDAGALHQHEATRKLVENLRPQLDELRGLAVADMDAANEAAAVLGTELSHVRAELSHARSLVERFARESELLSLSRGHDAPLERLDDRAADFLNYAGSHRGFAAQADLWFNPPVIVTYGPHSVELAGTNERIVEVPYALRALGQTSAGGRVLDVGAAESTIAFSLACLGYQVTAVDPRGYPLEHPGLRVVTGGVEDLEDSELFDGVVCLSTIEHIGVGAYGQAPGERGDLEAMQRIRELTRPGGLLVLTTPFGRAGVSETERRYDRAGLDELLTGWEIEELAFARQTGPTAWAFESKADGKDVDRVALVTARRSP